MTFYCVVIVVGELTHILLRLSDSREKYYCLDCLATFDLCQG